MFFILLPQLGKTARLLNGSLGPPRVHFSRVVHRATASVPAMEKLPELSALMKRLRMWTAWGYDLASADGGR